MSSRRVLQILLLILPAFACAEDPPPPAQAGAEMPARTLDPAFVRLADWEWYHRDPAVLPWIEATIVRPDGAPIDDSAAGARLMLPPTAPSSLPREIARTSVDERGRIRFEEAPPNAWVFVEAPGYAGRMVLALDVFNRPGQPIAVREATTVEGIVRNGAGDPVVGVGLMASTRGPDWFAGVETDAKGRFAIPAAPRERITLALVPGAYYRELEVLDLSSGEPKRVEWTVVESQAVNGLVVDPAGAPVPGAVVTALAGTEVVVRTDAEGRFTLRGISQPLAFVRAHGFGEAQVPIPPRREREESIRVVLTPGGGVTGRVVDENDAGVAGARLKARYVGTEGGFVPGPLTDGEGRFLFSWLHAAPNGAEVQLLVQHPEWSPSVSGVVRIDRGRLTEDVTIRMQRPGRLAGRIVDDAGEAIALATIHCQRITTEGPGAFAEIRNVGAAGRTGPDGAFVLPRLVSGRHELNVRPSNRLPWSTVVEVKAGEAKTEEYVIPRGLSIAGRLDGGRDEPIEGALLLLVTSEGRHPIEIDDEGRFAIHGLEPGRYRLTAQAAAHDPAGAVVEAGTEDVLLFLPPLSDLVVRIPDGVEIPADARVEIRGRRGDATTMPPLSEVFAEDKREVRFPSLPAGTWNVLVRVGDRYAQDELVLARGRPGEYVAKLMLGGSVEGHVSHPDGQVISGIAVTLIPATGPERTMDTDRSGHYRFDAVPPGVVRVRVHPAEYPPTEREATVAAGEVAPVDLPLRVGGRIAITAAGAEGAPAAGVRVSVHHDDGRIARFGVATGGVAETDASGTLELIGLLPGRYSLVGRAGDRQVKVADVEVRDGEATTVELRFGR